MIEFLSVIVGILLLAVYVLGMKLIRANASLGLKTQLSEAYMRGIVRRKTVGGVIVGKIEKEGCEPIYATSVIEEGGYVTNLGHVPLPFDADIGQVVELTFKLGSK